ncbi:MAG: hypothetical protein OXH05_07785 [Acidobacteria bacterium]|nr:hypothetical protein [Acidobacteriota bacterium]
MKRPPVLHTRRDAAVVLVLLLLPLLLAAIVLALSALFSSPDSRRPSIIAQLLP